VARHSSAHWIGSFLQGIVANSPANLFKVIDELRYPLFCLHCQITLTEKHSEVFASIVSIAVGDQRKPMKLMASVGGFFNCNSIRMLFCVLAFDTSI
jgi:hypothetical protein